MRTMNMRQIAELTGFSEEKLKKHNVFETDRFFLDVYCLHPGQSQKPHAHAGSDKVYVVLDGQCRFTVGSEVRDGGPGTAVLAPAGVDHGVENPSTMDARLLVMMTPPPKH